MVVHSLFRYEYADESNISQPSSMYADPPLFKEEMSDESHFFLHSNNSNQSLPFPASTFVQVVNERLSFFDGKTMRNYYHCPPPPQLMTINEAFSISKAHDDENLQPPVAAFSPFAIADTSQELHYSQPAPSSVDYFFWQSDEASSSSVCAEERRQMYEQYGGQKQMRRTENDKNTEQCQRNGERRGGGGGETNRRKAHKIDNGGLTKKKETKSTT